MASQKKIKSPSYKAASYNIPIAGNEITYEIKKSRFIARVFHVPDKITAKGCLKQAKLDYPDARHHCWAYQFGPPHSPHSAAMSDDGEPSGTAGKPILNVLQHKDIGDIMVIVIRYFGGIKLGAGGLVRAYSHTAQLAIENTSTKMQVATTRIIVTCDFHQEQNIRYALKKHAGNLTGINYQQQVSMAIDIPINTFEAFEQHCKPLNIDIKLDQANDD